MELISSFLMKGLGWDCNSCYLKFSSSKISPWAKVTRNYHQFGCNLIISPNKLSLFLLSNIPKMTSFSSLNFDFAGGRSCSPPLKDLKILTSASTSTYHISSHLKSFIYNKLVQIDCEYTKKTGKGPSTISTNYSQ